MRKSGSSDPAQLVVSFYVRPNRVATGRDALYEVADRVSRSGKRIVTDDDAAAAGHDRDDTGDILRLGRG